ncbi:unnamed protein product (macronuclear) [Paramecium tetraurelia]|uniref:Uncharacterized protein n=1 Tax=Paramecium tetraurelia TaxID=5888 RepID=A0E2C7_PARTE|nr:uncharacterized protein GSPATT00022616001 [Paramecium tetraurelia]CAK89444.1 unnamed protein product [Paramecium tetraurelia]|eukprot:XP_001456841.1 hypothetical protein (macronuclear) [Paramecium tetraurelia strain d4-2]
MAFFGKVLLLAALAGYSFLLFTDVQLGKQFDAKYAEFQKNHHVKSYIAPDYFKLLPAVLARQVIAGLIASSALMFFCGCLAFFPVVGLLLQAAITANPLINNDQSTQIELLKTLALVGGLLLWSSSNCAAKKVNKVKQE